MRFERLPELKPVPSDPDAPLLPDIDIDIGRLKIDRLLLGPTLGGGTRRVATVDANAHIADGRAQLTANAAALGPSDGDRVRLVLDAVPEDNKLDIEARLQAPSGGILASLAGLTQPLSATLTGRGSWTNWRGELDAVLGGGRLADLELTAKSGTFTVRGPLRPGLYLQGPVERLTQPGLFVDLVTTLEERRADTRFALRSQALAVTGQGLIDLAESRFGNFQVDARLLTPGAIADNLNGRGVRAQLSLDGAFARPTVAYKVSAASLGFGTTIMQDLYAEGRATVNADRILVPVNARVARIIGLNAAAGRLLTNVRASGEFALSGDTLLSDNIKLVSPQIDATAIVVADLSTGIYRGALKGRVNDYLVDGVGIFNLTTDVDLVTTPSGGFGLSGRFGATTVRIDNSGARDFLGGQTVISGNLSYDPQGVASVTNLRVVAPLFTLANGRGSFRPDGQIAFTGRGNSRQYGIITVDVSGTIEEPVARLRASRPGFGVGLVDLDARVRGSAGGYAVVASGDTDYGPFTADLLVRAGQGPLTITINRARFAGVDLAGRVQQAAAGPFIGRLTANGSGINGVVALSAVGQYQRAVVNARANNARVPGRAGLTIGRAIVDATVTLYAQPEILADVQLAAVRQNTLSIRTARAKVNYRGGRGVAQIVADGSSGQPFRIAANAQLSPDLYRVAAQGQFGPTAFRLAQPATIRVERNGYRLLPVALVTQQGQVRLAGRYGPGLEAQARFQNFDVAIVNSFVPGIGVGGRATGALDFVQSSNAAFPRAQLRLVVTNFTRSSAVTVSTPVDISAQGSLQPGSGALAAIIRRGGQTLGRAQVRLAPVGAGDWTTALFAAPLGGGIRYNGPADVLWSLAGIADQQVSGPIGVAADFSGRLNQPRVNGLVRANQLTYTNETFGTRVRQIRMTGRFNNDRFELSELTGRAGDGNLQATGSIGLASAQGFPIDIRAQFRNADLADSDAVAARVSGDLRITNSARTGGLIAGTLTLPETRYAIIRQGSAEVSELSGVRRRGTSRAVAAEREASAASGPPGLFRLDLRVRAPERLYVSGMGLESEWSADLRVGGTSAAPEVVGSVELVRGTYSFAGRRFDLDRTSTIRFAGGAVSNPTLRISATSDIEGTDVTLNVSGRAQNPQIALTSSPSLPQDELLSRILFGNSITELSATQAIQLASALNSLRGSGGGLNPLGKIRSATGVDRLRILGADENTGRGTAVAAGQYISNDIYVEIITDTKGFTATQLEIALSKALSILSQTGGSNGTAVNLRYSKDY